MIEIKKNANETEEQFLWRVGQMIDSGQIESWKSINNIINKELGIEEERWRDESAFRKRYQAAKKFYDNCFSKMESDTYAKEVKVKNDRIYFIADDYLYRYDEYGITSLVKREEFKYNFNNIYDVYIR